MSNVETEKLDFTLDGSPDGDVHLLKDYRIPTPTVDTDYGKVPMYVNSTLFQWTKHVSAAEATATAATETYAASQGWGELSASFSDVSPHGLVKVLYSYRPTKSFSVRFANDGSTYRAIKYRGAWLNANDAGIIQSGDTALLWFDGSVLHLITVDRRDRCDEMLDDGAYYPNAVQDRNGNWYGAVVIGKQVWLAENLKTRNRSDWTTIPVGGTTASDSTPYCYYPNGQSYRVDDYGLLYNWAAAMDGGSASSQNPSGVQGLSPDGWHIPSEAEFDQLLNYVASKPKFLADEITTNAVAKSLAARSGWNTSTNTNAVGNNPSQNNKTLFGAKATGTFNHEGSIGNFGSSTIFWTTTPDSSQAKGKYIGTMNPTVISGSFNKGSGFAIRCVCDLSPDEFRAWYVTQYGSLQHHLQEKNKTYYGYCYYDETMEGGVVSMLNDDFNYQIEEALVVLNIGYDVNGDEFFYYTTDGSSYTRMYLMYQGAESIPAHVINEGDTCVFQYIGGYLILLCVDRWGSEILGKQDALVGSGNGQNIKTVFGSSLPGSGNIDNVGVCNSAEYADALTASVDGFAIRDGAIAHIRFVNGIKTNDQSTYPKTLNINNTGAKSLMVWGTPNDFRYGSGWLVSNQIVASVVYLAGTLNYSEGYYLFATDIDLYRMRSLLNSKLSASDLKTINDQSLVGSGNISIPNGVLHCVFTFNTGSTTRGLIDKTTTEILAAANDGKAVICSVSNASEIYNLVSKNTLTFCRILSRSVKILTYDSANENWACATISLQESLVSGTTIKTINNESLLGSGNIDASKFIVLTPNVVTGGYKLSKSPSELIDLYDAGICVIVAVNGSYFYRNSRGAADFIAFSGTSSIKLFFYYSSDEDGVDTIWKITTKDIQRQLTSGTTIKTVNGNNLLGSGNIELGKGIITGSATSLSGSNAQATLNQSGADLENGAFLMISFSVDMPAGGRINVANTVINNSDILWNGSTLPAGAINAGDTCMLYYNYAGGTNLTFLLFNSGWGATLMDNDTV